MEHVSTVIRAWASAALDLLFPARCPACDRTPAEARRAPLCDRCWESISRCAPPWCAICGHPFGAFRDGPVQSGDPMAERVAESAPASIDLCRSCRRSRPVFAWARAAGLYDGPLREALHAFKFGRRTALAGPLAELLLEACADGLPGPVGVVVPVPLHPRREAERGFNQAALLARRLAREFEAPLGERVLRRVRATRAQLELTAGEREDNVRGAFAVRDPGRIAGRTVLLVDDVLTTGATVSECARALLAADARDVGVLTVARVA